MSSEYFTTTPEMKAPVEVAAAAGNYATFQVPVHGAAIPTSVPVEVEVEGSISQSQEQVFLLHYYIKIVTCQFSCLLCMVWHGYNSAVFFCSWLVSCSKFSQTASLTN